MDDENTYNIVYKCCNCYTKFIASIPIRTKALGHDVKCPHCGVMDFHYNDTYYIHEVLGAPVLD